MHTPTAPRHTLTSGYLRGPGRGAGGDVAEQAAQTELPVDAGRGHQRGVQCSMMLATRDSWEDSIGLNGQPKEQQGWVQGHVCPVRRRRRRQRQGQRRRRAAVQARGEVSVRLTSL